MNKLTSLGFNAALLILAFYCQAQNTYPDSIRLRISRVETGLTEWGRTHYEFPKFTLKEFMESKNIPGLSIAVINNYQIEWAKGYGWADKKGNIPVTTETAFMAASMSKSINAVGFLKLAEEGKIDLYEDINNLMTSWKFTYTKKSPINTYQLLSHTSGIRTHYVRSYNHSRKPPTVIEMLETRRDMLDKTDPYTHSTLDPGLRFQYSNPGISISQVILTDVTKLPYEQYIKQVVFNPIGMNNSFYNPRRSSSALASAYKKDGKRMTGKYRPVVEFAPSGLWTTPTDLAKFVIELQLSLKGESNNVLSKESTEFMLSPATQQLQHNHIFVNGLGSFIENHNGSKYFLHEGGGQGFSGRYYGSYEEGKGVVVMINSYNFSIINAVVKRVAKVYEWKNFLFNNGETLDSLQLPDHISSKCLGKYQSLDDPLNEMEVTIKNGSLHAQLSGGDDWYLKFIPLSETTFWAYNIPTTTTLEFQKDENGDVNNLTLSNYIKTSNWIKIVEDGK